MFSVPLLAAEVVAKMFVSELSHLFNAYYPGSNLEAIALKTAMCLPVFSFRNHFLNQSPVVMCNVLKEKLWSCW